MPLLVIAYELKEPGQNRAALLEFIQQFPSARLSESAYVVETSQDVASIATGIEAVIDPSDIYHVLTISGPYASYGPSEILQFFNRRSSSGR